MNHVRQAVILAAGLGSRLRGLLDGRPKGFLQLGSRPIIEESIAKLIGAGITNIVIVNGYRSEYYDRLQDKYPFLKTVKNPRYRTTGSMYSLAVAQDLVFGDFLLLESDLIYEIKALSEVQNSPYENCILLSGKTGSGDEVYAGVKGNRIITLAKDRDKIDVLGGELVGISKISRGLYRAMVSCAEEKFDTHMQYHYEHCLTDLSSTQEINYSRVENLVWTEIDEENHYQKAQEKIYPLIQRADKEKTMTKRVHRNVLLNPGPATTTDTVKQAMVVADICPREKDFAEMVEGIRQDLVRVVHGESQYEAILFASSGTGAVEACLTSVIPGDKSLLIINNGAYGQRMEEICDGFQVSHIDYRIDWGDPIDLGTLESLLHDHQNELSHLALVHHETTVGLLNPVEAVAELAAQFGLEIIVDAMSSFAGIPINVEKNGIHYLVASSNKCIQGMAGVSFVICHKKSLAKTKDLQRRNYYFNLYDNHRFFSRKKEMRFTPPVQVLYALRQAINEYFLETEAERAERYAEMYEVLRTGLIELRFRFLVDEKHHSKILTSIVEPESPYYHYDEMHDYLYERGFTIYPGKGGRQNTFRLANMGEINKEDIKKFLVIMKDFVKLKGIIGCNC